MTGTYLVVGPDRHGVVQHALRLARSTPVLADALVRVPSGTCLVTSPLTPSGRATAVPSRAPVLVHVTDRLFGRSPEEAADHIVELAEAATLCVSLHDVPQPGEGAAWSARRRTAYGRIAAAATHLIVASESERLLLAACVDEDPAALAARTSVIPLPVEAWPTPVGPPADDRPPGKSPGESPGESPAQSPAAVDIGVLGFLYPGKGVEELIDAAAGLPGRVGVTNYGAAAAGHEDLVSALRARADRAGVPFRVTGYLSDQDLRTALRHSDIPVAPHRHVSASGSINTWLECGRRPVVAEGPYTRELAQRLPGAVTLTTDLRAGLTRARDEPDSTWLGPDVRLSPSWAEAARAHATLLEGLG